ncbi:MAG: S41 family peptidase [Chloroflexota bacterium]
MKHGLRSAGFTLLTLLLVGLSFAAGYLYRDRQAQAFYFPILEEVYRAVELRGLKDLPDRTQMEYGLIRGFLQAYDDPYTVFLEPPQNELESNRLEGRYGGIGAEIKLGPDGWLLYPFPDSPAAKAGLQEGDRLLAIEGQAVGPQTASDTVLAGLRGPVGSLARLSVGRAPDYRALELQIERAEIPLPSVTYRLDSQDARMGVVQVNWIAATTANEIQAAFEALQQRGATLFALDLRNNPGGLLDAGVNIARLFLKDGIVMHQQYRGRPVDIFKVEQPGPLADAPLVVLINQGSASAAEIAAGALQAQRRARLIGEPSYGKDTIQLVIGLQDGSSLHVTSAHWWIPGLEGQAGNGLQPDYLALPVDPANPSAGDPYLRLALDVLLGRL